METEYQKSEGTGKRNTENSERLFQMLAFQQNNQSDLSKRAAEADRIFLPAFFVPFFEKNRSKVVTTMISGEYTRKDALHKKVGTDCGTQQLCVFRRGKIVARQCKKEGVVLLEVFCHNKIVITNMGGEC